MPTMYDVSTLNFVEPSAARFDAARISLSLYSVLTGGSFSQCQVDGIKILRRGTPEWDTYLQELAAGFKARGLNQDSIQRIIADNNSREIAYPQTTFKVTNYLSRRIVYDAQGAIICELIAPTKEAHAFRGIQGTNLFVDAAKKARYSQHFFYDGSFSDAFAELGQNGFRFILWDHVWSPGHIQDGERTQNLAHITPRENVGLEDMLAFMGQANQK